MLFNFQLRIRVSEIPLVSLHLRLPAGYPSRDFPELEIKAPGLAHTARNDLRQGTQTDTQDEKRRTAHTYTQEID